MTDEKKRVAIVGTGAIAGAHVAALRGPDVRGTIEFLASLYKSAMTGQPVVRGSIGPADPFYHRMCGPCDQRWNASGQH